MATTLSPRDQEERSAQDPSEAGAGSEGFLTDDLALATVLSMQGYDTSKLVLRREGSRQAEWFFGRDDQLDELVRMYRSGSLSVEPARFIKSLRSVRRQLYAFLNRR